LAAGALVPLMGSEAGGPDASRNCVLSVPDSWYRMKSRAFGLILRKQRAEIGSSREDYFMKVEIEYCGQ
jgi:hypothetical protein